MTTKAKRTPVRAAARHDGWTPAKRAKFIEVLGATANVTAAAAAAKKAKCTAYTLRARDAEFAEAWEAALRSAVDELVAVAFDRILNGVPKTVVRAGGDTVEIREYSDRILMFMLSRHKPAAYAELSFARGERTKEDEFCEAIEARIAGIEARRGER